MREDLEQSFAVALVDTFGKRRLSDALRDVADLVAAARARRVPWQRLSAVLSQVLVAQGAAPVSEATLRGIMRRIDQERARARTVPSGERAKARTFTSGEPAAPDVGAHVRASASGRTSGTSGSGEHADARVPREALPALDIVAERASLRRASRKR